MLPSSGNENATLLGTLMKSSKITTRLASDKNLLTALEVFVAIAETRQVTQAARLMGMTQSAASQQLASLEDACDARLIDRTVRPLRLTQEIGRAHV